jgi:glutamate dehydrogenase/leucine dehydrogenase
VITKKNIVVNIRQAAYAVAVDRVVEAMRLRSWV